MVAVEEWGDQIAAIQTRTAALETGKADVSLVQNLETLLNELRLRVGALEKRCGTSANFVKEAAQGKEEEEPKERVEKLTEGDSVEGVQARPKNPRSAWEEVTRKRAVQEEGQRKPTSDEDVLVQENGEKAVPAVEEEAAAARAKAAAEETARKKAAQDEAMRKRAAAEESALRARAAEEETARKRAAQAEAERKKAEDQRKAAEQEAAAQAQAAEEELAKKKAAQEESERKKAEEETAARARAAEEEVARKKAAQEEASRKRAADAVAAEERATRAAAAEEEAARKKAAQEESKRKQTAEAEAAEAESGKQEQAARTLAAEEEAARKKVAQEEAMRKRSADKAPEEAEAQKRAAEEERARKSAAAVESARKKAAEQEVPSSGPKDAQAQAAPQPNGVSTEVDEDGVPALTPEELSAARKAADMQRKQRMAQAMQRTRQVFEQSALARKAAQDKDKDKAPEEPAKEKKDAEKKAEKDVPGAETMAAKRAAEEQAKKRAIDEKKEEDKDKEKDKDKDPLEDLDDEVISASEDGDDLPNLCGADGQPVEQPGQAADEPVKEKKIDYSRFDEIEDSDEEKAVKEKKDEDLEDAEEMGLKSAKSPFPDELLTAEAAFKAADGVEAAAAAMSYAEVLLSCARYEEARTVAAKARQLFQEREGLESKAMGEAGAVKLLVKILLEEEKLTDALQMANDHFEDFNKNGAEKAAAVAQLALADVYLALERPGEALKVAKQAQDTFKRLEDNIWVAKVLQTTAMVNQKKGTPSCLKTALKDAEEGMNYFSIVGDTKEEAATLLTISKAHMGRQEFQDAFTKADKAASLCRDAGHKKGEAEALREVTNALVQLKEENEVSLQAAMEALELSEEIGDPLGEISGRQLLASLYVQSNVAEMAEKSLGIALEAARILKDRRIIKAVLDQVVQVQLNGGNTDKVLAVIQKEVKLAAASGDRRRQLAAYQTLSSIQVALEKKDEAMETANEAVKLGGETDDKRVHGWALQLMAEVHMQSERFQEALAETEKARAIFKELNDVKEVAGTWSLTINIQGMMNNMQGAVASKTELRNAYKEAGWRDEEAAELLSLADLHQRVKGPREAVKIAREAVTLYQEMGDKVGEATAVMALASFQAAGRSFTDALSTMRNARKLFQAEGDVNGEVTVLLNEGSIYHENGRADEAIKVITEGKDLSQNAGERRAEADCLKLICQMRGDEVKKEAMTGRKLSEKPFEAALNSVQELVEISRQMGNLEDQVDALFQLSGLHAMNKDEAALEIAQEALSITMKLNEADKVGTALLAICDAHQAQENHNDAREAAQEAANQFQAAGDQQNYEMAKQIEEACKQAAEAPKMPAAKTSATNGSGPNFMENRGLSDRLKSANSRMPQPGGRGPNAEAPNPMSQKKTFAFSQTQLGEKPYATPNQELKRQQLTRATEAHAQPPRFQADEAAPGAGLREVLHSVRPDWTTKDLHSVQEKLSKINVGTSAELFRLLRSQGAGGVNKMLKNAGQKILKIETLQALQDRANE